MAPRRGKKRSSAGGSAPKKGGRGGKKQKADETQGDETQEEKTQQEGGDSSGSTEQQQQEQTGREMAGDESKYGGEERKEEEAKGPTTEVLEKGHLYFFYRPKVDAKEVHGPDDVQKLYILMSPDGAHGRPVKEEEIEGKRGEERSPQSGHAGKHMHRLLVVSQKQLPSADNPRNRPWAFVDAVSSDLQEVEQKLERYSYDTKTRGHREIQPARLIAEARYELVKHGDDDSQLLYELELPAEPTEVQRAFNIEKQGRMHILVKNPLFNTPARSDRWAGFREGEKAEFASHLQAMFKGKIQPEVRYRPITTTEFLNTRHCELVLIPGRHSRPDVDKYMEDLEKEVEQEGEKTENAAYKELGMSEKNNPDAVEQFK